MKERILKLRNEGKTYNEIKKLTGASKGTISYHCGEGQKGKTIKRLHKLRRRNKEWLDKYKDELECEVCGENRHWVLDFHHKDPSEKEEGVSRLVRSAGIDRVLQEIDKCIVLCANCHRDLHYKERTSL